MQSLETKELVLKVSGEVQASNIAEFEEEALQHIANIKTELVTDHDFAEAKQIVKSCKTVETRLTNILNTAFSSMDEIAAIRTTVLKLSDKFRDTRLMLDKKVKSEEALRKSEITTGAVDEISKHLDSSQVAHGFHVDIGAINDAIKNKRSLEKMKESVAAEVDSQKQKIDDLEKLFLLNSTSIQNTEKEYPGLFPDAKRLALSPEEVVQAQIESRVNKFKFDQAEKERKEKERKEAEEKRRIEAEKMAAEHAQLSSTENNTKPEQKETERQQNATDESEPVFDPPAFTPATDETSFAIESNTASQYALFTVAVEPSVKLSVFEKIQSIFGVISVEESE